MAEVAELHLPEEQDSSSSTTTIDSSPFEFDREVIFSVDPNLDDSVDPFSPQIGEFVAHTALQEQIDGRRETDLKEPLESVEIVSSGSSDVGSVRNLNGRDCGVSVGFDLFERGSGRRHVVGDGFDDGDDDMRNPFADDPFFGVIDGNYEVGCDYNELWLGLGLGFERAHHDGDGDDDVVVGDSVRFMIDEGCEEFFVGRREESAESSEPFKDGNGLRVVGIESESDEEEDGVLGVVSRLVEDDELDSSPDDLGLPLCWDCLRLEDQRESNEDFEWEQVDDGIDDREVLSMVIDVDEEERSISYQSEEVGETTDEAMRNLEWEILLQVNNLERNHETEHDFDQDEYIYPAEYDMLFGQFTDSEVSIRGSPPAAKSVVNSLPSIFIIQEDGNNEDALCAICKDEILSEEQAKLLPCSHYYHGDCILPWLDIRNTCPVCRFELPTDDPEYERSRTEGEFHGVSRAPQTRFDFEIFVEP